MVLEVELADGPAGNALADLNACYEAADAREKEDLFHLLYQHALEVLATKSGPQLERYHRKRGHWRIEQGHAVYRTIDRPRMAYTIFQRDGAPVILILGFCLGYPTTEDAWWNEVIRPRLIEHL